ncbi:uncharacterized protein LOC141909684 isoform X2 [Tubulanus polymorphus]|uniref:uncharacterized protein LOC141909684 isoform X2 n=1 Tax=Tubulanus polymorphus TaxID=672921 RepID=UPI003DA21A84
MSRSLNVVAIVLLSVIWANAKAVDEEQFENDAIDYQWLRPSRDEEETREQSKRHLSDEFENKHFMTTHEFQQLGTSQAKWDEEMTRRLHFHKSDPAVIPVIVAKDYFRLQNDVAEEGRLLGGNRYETKNRYRVYEFHIQVVMRADRRRAIVTRLVDRGVVHLNLSYNPRDTSMTVRYGQIVGPGRNRQIALSR